MRTSTLFIVLTIAWLGGCKPQSKPLPLPDLPTASGGEYYVGGHVKMAGVFRVSDPPQTLSQVVLAAEPLAKLEPNTGIDVIRRFDRSREELHRFNWSQLENDHRWIVHGDDQIMIGMNEGTTNCFGPSRPNPFDHRN